MKRFSVFGVFMVLMCCLFGQTPEHIWSKKMGGVGGEGCNNMVIDNKGNILTTGSLQASGDFDPGPATFTLSSQGLDDIFISKLNSAGDFIWAKSIGSSNGGDVGNAIAVDKDDNIYVCGFFRGTADFDPGPGAVFMSSLGVGIEDAFILKLDSLGNFIWAKSVSRAKAYGIETDTAGNVFIVGTFELTQDFDPGIGVSTLTSEGSSDLFVLKLDSDGEFLWVRRAGGLFEDEALAVDTDLIGNAYVVGAFRDTIVIGSTKLVTESYNRYDAFIAKIDSSGTFRWVHKKGDTNQDHAVSVYVDGDKVFWTGDITGKAFIEKRDTAGSLLWVNQLVSTSTSYGKLISTDTSENVFLVGRYSLSNLDHDPGSGVYFLPNPLMNSERLILSKFNSQGNFITASSVGGSGKIFARGLAINKENQLYISGYFDGQVDFDPGAAVENMSGNPFDVFVLSWNPDGPLIPLPVELLNFRAQAEGSAVFLTWITDSERNNSHFEVEKSRDGVRWLTLTSIPSQGVSVEIQSYQSEDLSPFSHNYYRLKQIDLDGGFLYSKVVEVSILIEKWQISPNPSTGTFHLRAELPTPTQPTYTVLNQLGKVVWQAREEQPLQVIDHQIDLSTQPVGIYHLRISDGHAIFSRQLVVQR